MTRLIFFSSASLRMLDDSSECESMVAAEVTYVPKP